jgi:hypothetical protein
MNRLVDRRDVSHLGVAAAAHEGLVAIHPFHDGNGQLARILANWGLAKRGVPFVVALCASQTRRSTYIAALRGARGPGKSAGIAAPGIAVPVAAPGMTAAIAAAPGMAAPVAAVGAAIMAPGSAAAVQPALRDSTGRDATQAEHPVGGPRERLARRPEEQLARRLLQPGERGEMRFILALGSHFRPFPTVWAAAQVVRWETDVSASPALAMMRAGTAAALT